jgi:tetraacyldisaccharide 4'-kinase
VKLLASIFGAAVRLRNGGYDRGLLRARRLAGPVVSVGNLSVGGSGKTPFVILLGEHLKARSIPFDVLTRGYGRGSREILAVEPGGDARRFGDEPLLIARRLQVPVIVGADRYASGRWSEEHFGPRLHLLDDGFQHRQLARDFEIVMASPEDAADRLLPAGRLREPVASLRRTDAVVLAEGASTQGLPLAGRQLWRIRRGICAVGVPPRPLAFCGIARPRRFFTQLREAGIEPAAEITFHDHHAYTEKDADALRAAADRAAAGGFVTTEKDALNLGHLIARLDPVAVVPVTMELLDSTAMLDFLLRTLDERRRRLTTARA